MNLKIKPNLKKRIIATLLDYGLFILSLYLYTILVGKTNEDGSQSVTGLLALPVPIAWFIYFVVIESTYGATFAHQALDLKVLQTSRQEISFKEALKRHLLDPIDFFLYGIPAIVAIKNSDKHQRLGDMWANTIVVDMKDPEQFYPKQ